MSSITKAMLAVIEPNITLRDETDLAPALSISGIGEGMVEFCQSAKKTDVYINPLCRLMSMLT